MITLVRVISCTAHAALALFCLSSTVSAQSRTPEAPPPALDLQYRYVGYLGLNHGESSNCSGARRDGTIVVEAALRHAGGLPPGNVLYTGTGRVSMNVDECDLKPTIEGHDYCTISMTSSYDANVRLEVLSNDEVEPNDFAMRVKPAGPVAATAGGDCTAATIAQALRELRAGQKFVGEVVSVQQESLLRVLTRGGIPRSGAYNGEDDPAPNGKWSIALTDGNDPCAADSIALARAREQVANAARDAQATFSEMQALAASLASIAAVAQVGSTLESRKSEMTSSFAARSTASAVAARDAADAAYGRAVASVAALQTSNGTQVASAQGAGPGGIPDPRLIQLSQVIAQFGAQAQMLQTSLSEVARYRQRLADCLGRRG